MNSSRKCTYKNINIYLYKYTSHKKYHIFREGNVCADKLTNLRFMHRESFHWYNRLPSSFFLEFFINRYSLPMYRFC